MDNPPAPVIDPTKNVLDRVALESKFNAEVAAGLRREMRLRADHASELRIAEAKRIDAIRAVDVQAVQTATSAANAAAGVLDQQLQATAEAARTGLELALTPLRKDITELREAMYQAQGQKTQHTESRLSVGMVVGIVSLVAVILFGVMGIAMAIILRAA